MFIPAGEYAPDRPAYKSQASGLVKNVIPRSPASYGPMASLAAYAAALTERCQGAAVGVDSSGNVMAFAGSKTKLWRMAGSTPSFSDVSATAYTTATDGYWRFAQFGARIIATNYADDIQTFSMGSSTLFGTLAAAAPKARYVTTVKDWLMVANTNDSSDGVQTQRVWWPAINDPTNWPTPGTSSAVSVQSDFQDIPGDQGAITGLVGNLGTADVAIFFERAVWRGIYQGSPLIFSFSAAQGLRGCPAPNSIAQLGNIVYFLGEDGFYAFDGTSSTPIGVNRVDKTFWADVDQSYLYRIYAAVDPIARIVFWAYPGSGNTAGACNKILAYSWAFDKWSYAEVDTEVIVRVLSLGYTLDDLDTISASLDALSASLDSRLWTGGKVQLAAFDTSHKLGFFTGTSLAATVETTEVEPFASANDEQMPQKYFKGMNIANVMSARPAVDGGSPTVSVATRNRLEDDPVYADAVAMNDIGECPQRVSGRYVRSKIDLPAASSFSHIQGVELSVTAGGKR